MPICGCLAAGGGAARPSLVLPIQIIVHGESEAEAEAKAKAETENRRECFEGDAEAERALLRVIRRSDYEGYSVGLERRHLKCGTKCWVVHNDLTDEWCKRSNSCGIRGCPPDDRKRTSLLYHGLLQFFEKQPEVRKFELTLRSTSNDREEALIARINQCFHKLCRDRFWKRSVTGSCLFVQSKWEADTRRWHVHLHIVYCGSYIPVKWLSKKWLEITGDSFVVWIRPLKLKSNDVKELRSGLSDAVRYVTNAGNFLGIPGSDDLDISDDKQLEHFHSLQKARLFRKSGICRRIKLRPDPSEFDSHWHRWGEWAYVRKMAGQGDKVCQQIALAIQNHTSYKPPAWYEVADEALEFPDGRFTGLSPVEKNRAPPPASRLSSFFINYFN